MTAFRVMFMKELRSLYRNPMGFAFLLLMPFILMAIISQAFEPFYEGRATFDVPLVDLDRSAESEKLVAQLDALDGIEVAPVDWAKSEFGPSDADELLDDDDSFVVVVIPADYAEKTAAGELVTVSLYSDPQQEAYASTVSDQLRSRLEVNDLQRAFREALADETSPEEAERIMGEEVAPRAEQPLAGVLRLETEKRKVTPANFEHTVPGFAMMFTFWLAIFVAAGIHAEKRQYNTWRRTIVAPVSRFVIIASRVAAFTVIGTAQVLLLFVLGWLIFGLSLGEHPYALLPVFLAMSLVTTGFGILMTALIRDFVILNSVMNLVVLVAAAAGGALVPLFLLPDWLRVLSPAVPHYWAMDASQRVMLLNEGVADVLPDVGALLAFAAVFFAAGLWRFRFVD